MIFKEGKASCHSENATWCIYCGDIPKKTAPNTINMQSFYNTLNPCCQCENCHVHDWETSFCGCKRCKKCMKLVRSFECRSNWTYTTQPYYASNQPLFYNLAINTTNFQTT